MTRRSDDERSDEANDERPKKRPESFAHERKHRLGTKRRGKHELTDRDAINGFDKWEEENGDEPHLGPREVGKAMQCQTKEERGQEREKRQTKVQSKRQRETQAKRQVGDFGNGAWPENDGRITEVHAALRNAERPANAR